MHDPLIEDIEEDGIGIPIFIVHRKYGNLATNLVYNDEKELQQFVIKMAHLCKSYVSYASPLLDSILPDGSRVNATLTSNVSTRGPTFTIRKFHKTH
jgi:flagellar protein FlaI